MLMGALRAGARACGRTVAWHARAARRPAVAAAAAAGTTAAGIAFMETPTTRCETASVTGQLTSILTRLDRVESALDKKHNLVIRPGRPEDSEVILGMIHDLAILEKELDQVKMTAATLRRDGWPTAAEQATGAQPRFETFIAEVDGEPVGFALYFHIYSTWEGLSVYLEDLYVKPKARGKGTGTALIRAIARTAQARNCARFQWQVIDWNDPAIDFYKERLGARERLETGEAKWLNYIMDRDAIDKFLKS